ncbi:energy-coupling factor transporter transmembrane component T [Paenibacillus sp. 481]|uniref:energy-coupling factor transporter transmembrane component T n=1 Tax=Paenibacillus sp. 481 TaxID=2835869 RepID=UPI001E44AB17|nr:energy-coupling factor transporter transmembrane component T [Paenibacillus sp. 481]UHA72706.1 energy-coupling factor transporter transmembrane protein EcfT [Paenibacillus sp. 481]
MKPVVSFDPRTQLLIVLMSSLAVFLVDMNKLLWIIAFMTVYLLLQSIYKSTLQLLLLTGLLFLLQNWIARTDVEIIKMFGFVTYLGLRLMPVFMASLSFVRVPSGKLMAALQQMKLPMGMVIAITVSSRYMPVMRLEHEAIQTSASLRGVSYRSPKNWLRPLRTFEHTIVPLLMRSLKISDQLAASATTKGIDYPGKKTSIYQISFRWQDYMLLLVYVGWLFVVYQHEVIQ